MSDILNENKKLTEEAERLQTDNTRLREGIVTIGNILYDYDGCDPANAEQMKGLVDETKHLLGLLYRGESLYLNPQELRETLENERRKIGYTLPEYYKKYNDSGVKFQEEREEG